MYFFPFLYKAGCPGYTWNTHSAGIIGPVTTQTGQGIYGGEYTQLSPKQLQLSWDQHPAKPYNGFKLSQALWVAQKSQAANQQSASEPLQMLSVSFTPGALEIPDKGQALLTHSSVPPPPPPPLLFKSSLDFWWHSQHNSRKQWLGLGASQQEAGSHVTKSGVWPEIVLWWGSRILCRV